MRTTEKNIVDFLKDLILIPSTASNPDGLFQAVERVKDHLEGLPGLEVHEHLSGNRPSLVVLPGNGVQVETFLVGHLDVVDAEPESFYPRIEGNRLYGRGAGDMKGQVAILVEAFKALLGRQPGMPIGLMMTTDEESGGLDGVAYLVNDRDYTCSTAILPDSGSITEVVEREKGILGGRIVSHGAAGHSARPWLSDNAIHRLIRNITTLMEHFRGLEGRPGKWFPTMSTNILHTRNTTYNSVPESAEAFVDIRFTERETADGMIALVRRLVDRKTEFFPEVVAEPLVTEPDPLFLNVTERITGKPVSLVRGHGGSDGRFFTRRRIPVIMSRPNVGGLHSEQEWIEIDSMILYYRILEAYLSTRFRTPAERVPLGSAESWGD